MEFFLSVKEICEATGFSRQGVINRAKKEGWIFNQAPNRSGGGFQLLYQVNSLPDELKAKIFQHQYDCSRELIPAKNVDFDKVECLIERWRCASRKHRRRARMRSEILKAIDDFCKCKGFKQTSGEELFAILYRERKAPGIEGETYSVEENISVASIRRWRSAYRQNGLSGLLPNYRSTKGRLKAVTPEIQLFIIGHIKQKPQIRSAHLFKLIRKKFGAGPSRRTIYRFVDKWKAEKPAEWAMIEDPQRWKNNFMPAAGDAAAGVDHFCQMWEMDSTPADIITADGYRCTIVGLIDVYTRRAKLLVASTSKSTAIAACIRKGAIEWGIPESIRKDNGKDYSSNHIEAICTALDIETPALPKYASEKKPFIERFFGTFSVGLEELLPGYCGHSVAERQAIRARETWAAKIMTPGASVDVPLTLKEFQRLCDKWLGIYENSPHSSLSGKSPFEQFKQSNYFPPKVRDERVLDILLAPVSKPRRVLKKGISIDGHFYWSNELIDWIGKHVKCRRDLENAGLVYVFSTSRDQRFVCTATNEPLTGKRLEDYQQAKKRSLRTIKERTKALDELSLGNRNALQILVEDSVINQKKDNLVPFQLEADNPAIREAKKAAESTSEEGDPIDLSESDPKSTIRNKGAFDLAFDDYKTAEDLDRDLQEILEEAAKKKNLGLEVGKSR